MKKLIVIALVAIAMISAVSNAYALVSVRGYSRSNGTYVAPHFRTSPNSSVYDNFSY
ncbi:MAG: hypothetical protein NG740_03070 [Omnitrophica bacterium]|nr:hypothetical protein [Candidatus Omnitrophota bacterium]